MSLCTHLPNIDIITLEFASPIGKKQHLIFISLFISLVADGIEPLFAVCRLFSFFFQWGKGIASLRIYTGFALPPALHGEEGWQAVPLSEADFLSVNGGNAVLPERVNGRRR